MTEHLRYIGFLHEKESTEKYTGVLEIGKTIKLEIITEGWKPKEKSYTEIIFGNSKSGHKFTMIKNYRTKMQIENNITTFNFETDYLLRYRGVNYIEEYFKEIRVSFDINDFLPKLSFYEEKLENGVSIIKSNEFVNEFMRKMNIKIIAESGHFDKLNGLDLEIESSFEFDRESKTLIPYFNIKANQKMELLQWIHIIEKMRKLLSIFTEKEVKINFLNSFSDEGEKVDIFGECIENKGNYDNCFIKIDYFMLKKYKESFPNIIENYFNGLMDKEYMTLFFSAKKQGGITIDNIRLLSYGIEVYHKDKNKKEKYYYRKRIEEVFEENKELIKNYLEIENETELVEQMVDIRNYYTHFSNDKKNKLKESKLIYADNIKEQVILFQKLYCILLFVIMKQLKANEKMIEEIIRMKNIIKIY